MSVTRTGMTDESDPTDNLLPYSPHRLRFEDHIDDEMMIPLDITPTEVLAMQHMALIGEVKLIREEFERSLDRVKYYSEPITRETLESWIFALTKLERDFG